MAGSLDGFGFPRSWFEGLIARGRGMPEAAQRAFAAAHQAVKPCLRQAPNDPKSNMMLGLIDAMRGRKEDALRCGRRAVELLPVAVDAYDGPVLATNLAVIYAQIGEADLVLAQLAPLLSLPNGTTPGLLRIDRNGMRCEAMRASRSWRFVRREPFLRGRAAGGSVDTSLWEAREWHPPTAKPPFTGRPALRRAKRLQSRQRARVVIQVRREPLLDFA